MCTSGLGSYKACGSQCIKKTLKCTTPNCTEKGKKNKLRGCAGKCIYDHEFCPKQGLKCGLSYWPCKQKCTEFYKKCDGEFARSTKSKGLKLYLKIISGKCRRNLEENIGEAKQRTEKFNNLYRDVQCVFPQCGEDKQACFPKNVVEYLEIPSTW